MQTILIKVFSGHLIWQELQTQCQLSNEFFINTNKGCKRIRMILSEDCSLHDYNISFYKTDEASTLPKIVIIPTLDQDINVYVSSSSIGSFKNAILLMTGDKDLVIKTMSNHYSYKKKK
jgi:hypothetical protein